ncbi:MAG: aminomethyl-transferring glycine dehydrogenase, partial [Bacteroidaceae bacterium]|nr:aminomethyl-transferring glycine dehydrogenase [Bacteroidaceae bacterium]
MKTDLLVNRHVGITEADEQLMLQKIGVKNLDELINRTIPGDIRLKEPLDLPAAMTEYQYGKHIAELAAMNKQYTTYIGMGWYNTITPAVIQRNVFENPVWYTSYTPYQSEVSQGRLEALMNFQTAISDLTGMPLANCSLLDEATAAAEAVTMMYNLRSRSQQKAGANVVFVDDSIFPQTLAVMKTRAVPQGIIIKTGNYKNTVLTPEVFACIIQYPNADGNVEDYHEFVEKAHASDCKVAVAADILSLALLTPPGEWGADIVFGSSQRLGTPMFYGGPSAAYFATRDEYKRQMPGRIIGLSKDKYGKTCFRMALQTREQHIKREKATSNICTSQALLASMAGFYAVYHGQEGIRTIAERIHSITSLLAEKLDSYGYKQYNEQFFDTLHLGLPKGTTIEQLKAVALEHKVNLHYFSNGHVGLSIDETTDISALNELLRIFATVAQHEFEAVDDVPYINSINKVLLRTSSYLTHEVFQKYHTEMEMMRYIKRLDRKDISLTHSMISLGSCTMKMNPASEMLPLSLSGFTNLHPLVPAEQAQGYRKLINNLCEELQIITGFDGVTLQPNSGAAGEYTGLRIIRSYLESIGQSQRNIVLIPASAHGTNPASAVQAGFTPVTVACDEKGNVDLNDLREKAVANKDVLAALMITYPSTHGIFEVEIKEICNIIHSNGAQVYMDGANMNAQVGLTNPGTIGADVCHLNLHKTFSS